MAETNRADSPSADILHASEITPKQWLVIVLCVLASMLVWVVPAP